MKNMTYSWYAELIKPSWAPPAWVFGPVWSVLYTIITISYATVFYKTFITKELNFSVALPFILNLVFNFSFTYIQFGLRSNILATVDILLILVTLVWAILSIFPHIKWIAIANIPYLLWVSFATVLQCTVTYLNK